MPRNKFSDFIDWYYWILMILVGLALVTFSCVTSGIYSANVLGRQMLSPHPEFPGLVNRSCLKMEHTNCVTWRTEVQDTSLQDVRTNLQRLRFVCNVGGKIFFPCLEKDGLCRVTYGKRKILGIFGKKEKFEQFLSLTSGKDKNFLIAAQTVCFSWDSYGDLVE